MYLKVTLKCTPVVGYSTEAGAEMAEDNTAMITAYEGNHNHPLRPQDTAVDHTTTAAATRLLSGSTMTNNREPTLLPNSLFSSPSATLYSLTDANIATLSASAPSNCTPVGL
ncbi:hypothetical protein C5167_047355 [Papaver somniferum]|uniref:WRKY domain-containing protein n=1 Tax=Papaver somniferum TaxID=3469 RepID=A0A4Y7LK76_PAPSO|nr:hypothetical protein C5167_047355 [Papaver somniferum]